jgi:superfamily I DNA/RNA helicase
MCPSWSDGVRGQQVLPLIELDAEILRVEAGPGTGKTFGLVRRVERILHPDGLAARGGDVLIVAFNRVIAKQLDVAISERLATVEHDGNPRIQTIHALCLQIVGEELRILLPHEREGMLYDILETHNALAEQFGGFRGTDQALRDHEAGVREHLALWQATREWLIRHNAQLLTDLPALFLNRLDGGDLPDQHYQHIIVDEFQDLTPGEQQLIFRLKRNGGQLVALGDSRQSIYRFRGNDLLGLSKITEIAEARGEALVDIPLQECQRCPAEVVTAANRLMALADAQEMTPVSATPANLHLVVWDSLEAEAAGMAGAVAENIRRHPNEVHLVMTTRRQFGYRFRDQVHEVAPALRVELNFSESILETWAAREAFLFLSLVCDPDAPTWRAWLGYQDSVTGKNYKAPHRNSGAYLRFLEGTGDSISEDNLRPLAAEARGQRRGSGGTALWDRAQRFLVMKERLVLENLAPEQLLERVFDVNVWVSDEYEEIDTARLDLDLMRSAALALLTKRVERHPEHSASEHLKYVAKQLRYAVGTKEQLVESAPCDVLVTTLWGAKGVTADHVYILGACKEAIPGRMREEYPGTEAEYVAEQKRLFYVSITRTKKTLVISRARLVSRTAASRLGLAVSPGFAPMVQLEMTPFLREILNILPRAIPGGIWQGCSG